MNPTSRDDAACSTAKVDCTLPDIKREEEEISQYAHETPGCSSYNSETRHSEAAYELPAEKEIKDADKRFPRDRPTRKNLIQVLNLVN